MWEIQYFGFISYYKTSYIYLVYLILSDSFKTSFTSIVWVSYKSGCYIFYGSGS